MLDGGNPWGIREYFKVDYLRELPDEAIDTVIDAGRPASPSPFTQIILAPLGGAIARTDTDAMALNAPKTKWFYFRLAMWMDPSLADGERDGRARVHGGDAAVVGRQGAAELHLAGRGRAAAAGLVRRRRSSRGSRRSRTSTTRTTSSR